MEYKAVLLIISFTLLLIYVEMIICKIVIKPIYDKQNEYQRGECELSNKNYTKQITNPILYDPYRFSKRLNRTY